MERNGPVRTRKAASLGSATYDALGFMKEYLKNTPGEVEDVKAAAKNSARRCQNSGLVYGPLWEEHGVSWLIQLYTGFVQIEPGPDVEVTPEPPTGDDIPGGIKRSFGGGEPDEFPPAPFPPAEPTVLRGMLAMRFTLHGEDTTSTQKAIGLWTKRDILASVAYKRAVIEGRTAILEAWLKLADMLPNDDSIVHEHVTLEQLAALGLRGDE